MKIIMIFSLLFIFVLSKLHKEENLYSISKNIDSKDMKLIKKSFLNNFRRENLNEDKKENKNLMNKNKLREIKEKEYNRKKKSFREMDLSNLNLKGNKVSIELYVETLCSETQKFAFTSLKKIMDQDLRNIDLKIYAYGKAYTNDENRIICQHGEKECEGNKMINCAVKYLGKLQAIKAFICMSEEFYYNGSYFISNNIFEDIGKECFKNNYDQINDCRISSEGVSLLSKAGEKTGDLDHVPHVIIKAGNNSIELDYECKSDMLKCLCNLNDKIFINSNTCK